MLDSGIFPCQKMSKKKQNQFLLSNAFNALVIYNIEHSGTETKHILENI